MACFLVSAAEAVGVTVAKKVEDKKNEKHPERVAELESSGRIPFSRKLGWLMKMLWGGAFLLLIEHVWHGEVVPWFPFLTAMKNKEDTKEMLKEIQKHQNLSYMHSNFDPEMIRAEMRNLMLSHDLRKGIERVKQLILMDE